MRDLDWLTWANLRFRVLQLQERHYPYLEVAATVRFAAAASLRTVHPMLGYLKQSHEFPQAAREPLLLELSLLASLAVVEPETGLGLLLALRCQLLLPELRLKFAELGHQRA